MYTVNDANFSFLKNVHNIINECDLAYTYVFGTHRRLSIVTDLFH